MRGRLKRERVGQVTGGQKEGRGLKGELQPRGVVGLKEREHEREIQMGKKEINGGR